jgi:2-methylcitrate dehydratase PrpD
MSSFSASIANWIKNATIEAFPAAVVENAKLRMLDLLGVMIATRDDETVQAAKRASNITDPGSVAAAVASKDKLSITSAAFVNGVMASLMEFDDSYMPTAVHPSGLCNAVLFPECQMRRVSGRELIEASTIGSELMIRTSIVSPNHWHWFNSGLHPTGLFSVFGATAALAKLRDLDEMETVAAFGHAGSMSAGLTASFEDGTSTKTLHVGLGAANGFRAVALAQQGILGPAKVFEGKFGWYRSHLQTTDQRDYEHITTELPGEEWKVLEIASKLYPVAYTLMPHIEAAIALRNRHSIKPDDVTLIDAYLPEKTFKNLCEPREVKIRPVSTWHGRISLQHTIAEALVVGKMDKYAFANARINCPVINELASKVFHHADQNNNPEQCGAKIVVKLRNGDEHTHEIVDFPGTKNNPLRIEDYLSKFRANVGDVLAAPIVEQTIDDFLNLERIDDTARTLARLCS